MKKYLIFALTLGLSTSALAENIQIGVNGMVCSFCAQGITKNFKKESVVQKVDVNLDKKLVTLETKAKGDLSDEKISSIIKDSGYDVTGIKRL